jgi:hypothetical protein
MDVRRSSAARRRAGVSVLIDLHTSEIDAFVRRGLLRAETRNSERAIKVALYAFLDRTLVSTS